MSAVLVRLPVAGQTLVLNAPSGADEMLALETPGGPLEAALALLDRLASFVDQDARDPRCGGLAVTDFEWTLLALRRALFGDTVRSDFTCTAAGCGERVEMEFSLADYVTDVRPRRPAVVSADHRRQGWFRVPDAAFRLPTVEDQIAARQAEALEQGPAGVAGAGLLAARCIEAQSLSRTVLGRVERAMASMAPELSRPLDGQCPACGARLGVMFDVSSFVLAEMRRAFAATVAEVDLIASAYHWSEAEILALSRSRRQSYAERIRLRLRAA